MNMWEIGIVGVLLYFLYVIFKPRGKDYYKEEKQNNKTREKLSRDMLMSMRLREKNQWSEQSDNLKFTTYSKVVGVTFENNDGTSRQKNIKKYIKEGNELFFEAYKYEDSIVLGLLAKKGNFSTQIGVIHSKLAKEILDLPLDSQIEIRVKNITGGTKEKQTLGVNIEIFSSHEIDRDTYI